MNLLKILAILLISTGANAAENTTPPSEPPTPVITSNTTLKTQVGALLGAAFVTTGNKGTYFNWGLNFARDVHQGQNSITSLGLSYSATSTTDRISNIDVTQKFSLLTLDILSRKLFGSDFYVGARLGYAPVTVTAKTSSAELSSSGGSFAYGPVIGSEIPINQNAAVRVDLSYVSISGSEVSGDLGRLKYDTLGAILTRVGVQFYF